VPRPRPERLTLAARDKWAEWLAERRYGGDPETRRRLRAELVPTRDRVLDLARLEDGETLLDVGCGDGLIAFEALRRGAGTVIFDDISTDLLDLCSREASELGILERCRFVEAPADDLAPIEDASVDVLTTRSVLIYVRKKGDAFREFARVLRPGGRISLFEPINRFSRRAEGTWAGYDLSATGEIGDKIRAVYEAIQPPDSDPMLDFDERDLIRLAEEAGFFPITLQLEARIEPAEPRAWEVFVRTSGNPNIPTLEEAMDEALRPSERDALVAHLRPLVEQGRGEWRMASAHLAAVRHPPGTAGRLRVGTVEA
jgi:arsenite methyltransferase